MPINFSNTNSIWASVLVETLHRLGLRTAIVCPGSRSTPLTLAFAEHPGIEAIPVLDERSAAFLALGMARRSGLPTALVCTSGTAGANFYPAVIEAYESRIPLLILTADRPPELRACNSGQTIDQQKLYGSFPNQYAELAVPELRLDRLAYLRQTIAQAWERSRYPVSGVVHLNIPFRDPLAPLPQLEAQAFAAQFDDDRFFGFLNSSRLSSAPLSDLPDWQSTDRGLIIAGIAQPADSEAYCAAIAHLSKILGFPILAEGLSPLRQSADRVPLLISTYDLILRQARLAKDLLPDIVIRVGEMPTSKELRQWLATAQPLQWVIDPSDRNLDPLHGRTIHLLTTIEQVVKSLPQSPAAPSDYGDRWSAADARVQDFIDRTFQPMQDLIESKAAWMLSQCLPPKTPVFIANSMPVRDVEWFWQPGRGCRLFCNRGANGIDGTLSTAIGIAHRQPSSVLLTGDLALLHDTNGFLIGRSLIGHLTIVLINNNGGGIFEMLPIAKFDPPFEEFFATPQNVDFAQLCATYGVQHDYIQSWEQLKQALNPLPTAGIRVLEIRSDRKRDASWRQALFRNVAEWLESP